MKSQGIRNPHPSLLHIIISFVISEVQYLIAALSFKPR